MCSLPEDSSNVVRVEFQHFTNIVKAKNPIFIVIKNPLGRLGEDSFSAPGLGGAILEIAVDRILEHGCDQFYFR